VFVFDQKTRVAPGDLRIRKLKVVLRSTAEGKRRLDDRDRVVCAVRIKDVKGVRAFGHVPRS